MDITVTLSESLSSDAEVQLSGYFRQVKTVTFPANSTSQTTSLTFLHYPGVWQTERSYTLRLGTRDVRLAANTAAATLTIVDTDEATVEFDRQTYLTNEGRSIRLQVHVTAPQVSCPADVAFNVYYSYTDPHGVIASGPTSLVFPFGRCQRARGVTFQINNDRVVNAPRDVVFTLDRVTSDSPGVASRVKFGTPTARLSVIDSMDRAYVGFEHPSYSVLEGDSVELCAVLREGDSVAFPFTVNLSYTDSDGSGPTSLTFGALDTKSCAEFQPRDDDVLSYTRTLIFRFARPSDLDRRIFTTGATTVEVIDDPSDRAYVEFEHASYSVTEGEAVEVCAVLRPGDSVAFPFTVNLSYTDPDGVVSSAPSSLRFGTLDTKSCAEFQTSDDDVGTGNSEVSFSLAGPSDLDRRIMVSRTTATLTVVVDDSPNTVSVTVTSNWLGRTVTVDGTDRTTPYTATWNSGSSHTLNVPSPQTVSGGRYVFSGWSHGGPKSQTVSPTSHTTYMAGFAFQPDTTNRAPTVTRFSPTQEDVSVPTGLTQTFVARASDPDNNLTSFRWYVNGVLEASNSLSPTGSVTGEFSHRFVKPGSYTVRATLADSNGLSDSASWDVEVKGPDLTTCAAPAGSSRGGCEGRAEVCHTESIDVAVREERKPQ